MSAHTALFAFRTHAAAIASHAISTTRAACRQVS
jgi:hypothetical protein